MYLVAIGALLLLAVRPAQALGEYRIADGAIEESHRGIALIAVPPKPGIKYGVTLVGPRRALSGIRRALDLLYRKSPSSVTILERLKRTGGVLIVYDPGFPNWTRGSFPLARFVRTGPRHGGGAKSKDALAALLSRHVIKYAPGELAGAIVHELVGHGIQHLEGRTKTMRPLDRECEAWLYQLQALQDIGVDKLSRAMTRFRMSLERRYCDDFKRYMRLREPSKMGLWETADLDVPRLLGLFHRYVKVARR